MVFDGPILLKESHLVRHEEHVVLVAQLPDAPEVSVVGHDHPGLALDGLHHEGAHVGVGDGLLQRGEVVVRDDVLSRSKVEKKT